MVNIPNDTLQKFTDSCATATREGFHLRSVETSFDGGFWYVLGLTDNGDPVVTAAFPHPGPWDSEDRQMIEAFFGAALCMGRLTPEIDGIYFERTLQ